jgi:hypothetical protein
MVELSPIATVGGAKAASTVEAVVILADLRLVAPTFPSRFGVERAFNAGEKTSSPGKANSSFLCQGWPNVVDSEGQSQR